jgi:hypothetical protein
MSFRRLEKAFGIGQCAALFCAPMAGIADVSDEAERVRNFLEDYWQFNEIGGQGGFPPGTGETDPFRSYYPAGADGKQRYVCGYNPGYHSYRSCESACKVPS